LRLYSALRRAGVDADMIPPSADFSKYSAVFAPALYIMPDSLARRLDAYVKSGGVLFIDGRSGVKDESGLCHERTLPGLLSDALGVSIEEYEAFYESRLSYKVRGSAELPGEYASKRYCDWVKPLSAEALASYGEWHLEGYAAATRNRYGKGFGFYLGCEVEGDSFYDSLAACVLKAAGVEAQKLPEGIESSIRSGAGRRLLFLVNHSEKEVLAPVPAEAKGIVGGEGLKDGVLRLGRYGAAVLRLA